MAAGGHGAPLVPFLDYVLFRHRRFGRIVQNIGGIGNLTAIPPRARPEDVMAFDTGPGNMVMDAVAERLFDVPFDRGGRLAAKGTAIEPVVRQLLRRGFFRKEPPKTAGREQFGREYVAAFLRLCDQRRQVRRDGHGNGFNGAVDWIGGAGNRSTGGRCERHGRVAVAVAVSRDGGVGRRRS